MIHELRIYHCAQGQLSALHARFQDATLPLWQKHGVQAIGFWTTVVGPTNQALTFMLRWESLAERERYEAEGPIVARIENQLLEPTVYSPLR